MNGAGDGTTRAINNINPALFQNLISDKPIYDPRDDNDDKIKDILLKEYMKGQEINGTRYPAGTVFFKAGSTDNKDILNNVKGVYHVNGFNLNEIKNIDNRKLIEEELETLVLGYYIHILSDFIGRTEDVIHLAQIPGYWFGGEIITKKHMLTAIKTFIRFNKNQRPIQINVDATLDEINAIFNPPPKVPAPASASSLSGGNYNLNKFKGGDPKSSNKEKVLQNFKNAFNTDQFDKEYTLNGGIRPDDRIFSMIRYIHDNIAKDNLLEVLVDNFKGYMHNRIGTSLKESEMNNLVEADNLRRGELVACLDNNRWGVIVDISGDEYTVYTHNEASGMDDNIKLTKVSYNNADLRRSTVILEQIAKPNQKLNDIDILETYTLDIKK